MGLLKPDAGTIRVDGVDLVADPGFARQVCSLQPQAQLPITGLTPRQAIDLIGRIRGGEAAEVQARRARLVEALDIGEWLETDGEKLSGGVKRLVSFAMAAVVPGRVIVLDELTNDVDPVRRRLLWDAVRSLADEGNTVLLVTHNVTEAERAVDRLAVLNAGRVVAEGTPAQMKAGLEHELRLDLTLEPGRSAPSPAPFVTRYQPNGTRARAIVESSQAAAAIEWAQQLRQRQLVGEFSLTPASLGTSTSISSRRCPRTPLPMRLHRHPKRSPMHTLHSYRLLVSWQTLRLQSFLPLAIVVQVMFAFGIVVGYPLLFPELDEMTVLFLATGAPAITLITMVLVALPQVVSQGKTEGTLEYMRSLPVPRMVYLMADLTVWLAMVLPGVVFAVAVGSWAFDLALSVSLAIVPAVLLVATTAAAIPARHGLAAAAHGGHAPDAGAGHRRAHLSPINYPAERLPEWMQDIHAEDLPVQAMGEVIRGSLAADTFALTSGPFILLTGRCVVALGL